MNISLIVAVGSNNEIGKNNALIWHMPADMKFFKEKTTGHCIITGRKNYESIPLKFRPLPNRTNIVVTRQPDYDAPGAILVDSIEAAIKTAKATGDNEIFIIGGADIFRQSLHLVDTIYLTRIHESFDADVFFPELNLAEWKEVSSTKGLRDEKNVYDFTFLVYKKR
ncbi:MAG TPA: dihydrofolate reductase [Bacteroidia bacterium]|jgi:dihydrofolate reductase|nr:dihydrofolate reductase [Bacteroidia bacterium]